MDNEKKILYFAGGLLLLNVLAFMLLFVYFSRAATFSGSEIYRLTFLSIGMAMIFSVVFFVTNVVLALERAYKNLPQEEQRIKKERGLAEIYDTNWALIFYDLKETQIRVSAIALACSFALVIEIVQCEVAVGSAAFMAWLALVILMAVKVAGCLYVKHLVKKQDEEPAALEPQKQE